MGQSERERQKAIRRVIIGGIECDTPECKRKAVDRVRGEYLCRECLTADDPFYLAEERHRYYRTHSMINLLAEG